MAYEEYRHPFVGPTGHDAVCHVRVYRPGDHVVVVLSELDENPGVSVTNAVELILSEVWTLEGRPPLDQVLVIEHYPPPRAPVGSVQVPRRTVAGDFDRVRFVAGDGQLHHSAGRWRRTVVTEPAWQHLELADVEAIIGEPWTPIPLGSEAEPMV